MLQSNDLLDSKPIITVWLTTSQLVKLFFLSLTLELIGYGLYKWSINIEKYLLLFFSMLFVALGIKTIQRLLVLRKKPLIICYENGFKVPCHDFISWEDIIGMFYEEKHEYTKINNIILGIKREKSTPIYLSHQMDLLRSTFKKPQDRVYISLSGANVPPRIVYDKMRQLWEKCTGNHYEWDPDYSDEYNLAFNRITGSGVELKTLTDFQIIYEEGKRKSRKNLWVAILTGLILTWFSWYLRN